jgi:hypothetical protein
VLIVFISSFYFQPARATHAIEVSSWISGTDYSGYEIIEYRLEYGLFPSSSPSEVCEAWATSNNRNTPQTGMSWTGSLSPAPMGYFGPNGGPSSWDGKIVCQIASTRSSGTRRVYSIIQILYRRSALSINLTGIAETRPDKTGGNSTATITAKVTSGGVPTAGVTVGLGVAVQPRTGGHTHGDLGNLVRPNGKLSISSGVTDANGEIKFKFTAPEPAGLHAIVADCSAAGCAAQATHVVTVKVPDLIHIPPDYSNTPARYTLVGNYGDSGNTYQRFNHTDTQFLSESAWEVLDDLIDTFIELGWGQVGINDSSLEWGGMFDISGKWLEPILNSLGKYTTGGHAEHRDGQQVDISFMRPASISNALRQKVFDEVCDGDGSALPPAVLWHQNDGYPPHFHIYLTGKKTSGAKAQCSKK